VVEARDLGRCVIEERAYPRFCGAIALANVGVFGCAALQHLLVVAVEGGVLPLIPNERDEARRTQNARELDARAHRVEPVKRLRGGDEIDRAGCKRRRLGAALDALEAFVSSKRALGRYAHRRVGLDSDDTRARVEEEASQHPRARAHIGYDTRRSQPARVRQQVEQRARVARPEANVVVDAVGEAFLGVAHG
jgi:hypothetical protein